MKIRLEDGAGLDLKYLVKDTDRHGNVRVYVRRHGRKVRIRDLATVEEFMPAYRAALESVPAVDAVVTMASPGSLRWLVQAYYGAPEFTGLHESTRAKRRAILDGICQEHGAKPFARMEARHVELQIRQPQGGDPGSGERPRQGVAPSIRLGNLPGRGARQDQPGARREDATTE